MKKVVGIDRFYDNSCYMNAGLQLLFQCPDLMKYLLYLLESEKEDLLPDDELVLRFMKLVAKYKFIKKHKGITSISKRKFYFAFVKSFDLFGYETQEDAQEFIHGFMDRMHEAFEIRKTKRKFLLQKNRTNNINNSFINSIKRFPKLFPKVISTSVIMKLFGIHMISTITCECGHSSKTIDMNNTCLSVGFPPPPPPLEENQQQQLNIKKEKNEILKLSTTKTTTTKNPSSSSEESEESEEEETTTTGWFNYLSSGFLTAISYLNFFSNWEKEIYLFGSKGCKITKILDHFFRPEILDLGGYVCEKCKNKRHVITKKLSLLSLSKYFIFHIKRFNFSKEYGSKIGDHLKNKLILNLSKYFIEERLDVKYELVSILNHSGTYSFGHYTCFVKDENNNWWDCDDEWVQRSKKSEVLNSQGYLLVFKIIKNDDQQKRNKKQKKVDEEVEGEEEEEGKKKR